MGFSGEVPTATVKGMTVSGLSLFLLHQVGGLSLRELTGPPPVRLKISS